jgi:ADP-heptose:LPS heptosyltransferase
MPRAWPIERFENVIRMLQAEFDVQIVLCGSASDRAVYQDLIETSGLQKVNNIAGQTTLLDMVEIIRKAEIVIGNDSSPVHIAAATDTPSICVLGGGHVDRFLPYPPEFHTDESAPVVLSRSMECFNCQWKCIFDLAAIQTVPCVTQISVEEFSQRCKALLRSVLSRNTTNA